MGFKGFIRGFWGLGVVFNCGCLVRLFFSFEGILGHYFGHFVFFISCNKEYVLVLDILQNISAICASNINLFWPWNECTTVESFLDRVKCKLNDRFIVFVIEKVWSEKVSWIKAPLKAKLQSSHCWSRIQNTRMNAIYVTARDIFQFLDTTQ